MCVNLEKERSFCYHFVFFCNLRKERFFFLWFCNLIRTSIRLFLTLVERGGMWRCARHRRIFVVVYCECSRARTHLRLIGPYLFFFYVYFFFSRDPASRRGLASTNLAAGKSTSCSFAFFFSIHYFFEPSTRVRHTFLDRNPEWRRATRTFCCENHSSGNYLCYLKFYSLSQPYGRGSRESLYTKIKVRYRLFIFIYNLIKRIIFYNK